MDSVGYSDITVLRGRNACNQVEHSFASVQIYSLERPEKETRRNLFKMIRPTHWGNLRNFQVPNSIIQNNQLVLEPKALAVLLVMMRVARYRRRIRSEFVTVKLGGKALALRTGYRKNTISSALSELEEHEFITRHPQRKKHGQFGASEFMICDPSSGQPLRFEAGKSLLHANNVPYFTVPVCFVGESSAHWSLAKLTSSEIALYVSLLWLGNRRRGRTFKIDNQHRDICGLSRPTYRTALEALEQKGLIYGNEFPAITLCDPYTGEPLHQMTAHPEDDPANYFIKDERGVSRRWRINSPDPGYGEHLIRWCIGPNEQIIPDGKGNFKVRCVFHHERTPSLSVNPSKRCFRCFGCERKGTLIDFVAQAMNVSKAEALTVMAELQGLTPEFHAPDEKAEAIYSYADKKGRLKKQVLRFPGKSFAQRRPSRTGGWIRNVQGEKPMLYRLPELQFANVVFICEGEKDADRINSLQLKDRQGNLVVGTTSGAANSWRDELADDLLGKRVVILPDADEPGRKYAEDIANSLRKRRIEFGMISFAEHGVKDVSEFLEEHPPESLVAKIGQPWFYDPKPEPLIIA